MNKKEQVEQLKILSNSIKAWLENLENGCNGDCYSGCTGCHEISEIDDFIERLLKGQKQRGVQGHENL